MFEGTVHNGLIVPDEGPELAEGTRVKFEPVESPFLSFHERYGDLMVDHPDAPTDLAEQHDHYRLGTPKR